MVARSDGGIEGGIGTAAGGGSGHVTFYVQCADPQLALEEAKRLGCKTVQPPTELPSGGVIALLADPEGHTIGLFTPAA